MQVRDQHKKPVNYKQWDSINTSKPNKPFGHCNAVEHISYGHNPKVRNVNLKPFTGRKYWSVGIVVARKPVVVPARGVEGQVQRPTEYECYQNSQEPAWRVVEILGVKRDFGFRFWNKHFVPFQGRRVGVVAAVAVFPREVRG